MPRVKWLEGWEAGMLKGKEVLASRLPRFPASLPGYVNLQSISC